MSEDKSDKTPAQSESANVAPIGATGAPPAPAPGEPRDQAPAAPPETLTDLMAGGAKVKAAPAAPGSTLEADALRAAEEAIAEGERALAQARGQLHDRAATTPRNRSREVAVRILLAINVLAMIVVAWLPTPTATDDGVAATHTEPPPAAAPGPRLAEPWNRALAAAEGGRFAEAITILEGYLSPRMPPSQQLNVLMALSHYAFRVGDFTKAQQYEQRANAIEQSHTLPADLVAMAKAAMASGDQETLRRVHARFLLQQRQIPSWLYKHVAEAYLQLGDSYRLQADSAAEQARRAELETNAARLRAEALQGKGGK